MKNIKVESGIVRISSIDAIYESEGCVVYEVHCYTKYPEIFGYTDSSVILSADKHTLHTNTTTSGYTTIELDIDARWLIHAEVVKYSVFITAVKIPEHTKSVWDSFL